ncbi:MAG: ABC transporter permease [Holophagales bacterium]|nr:ABC transporter permease [Holophagales bacterium]
MARPSGRIDPERLGGDGPGSPRQEDVVPGRDSRRGQPPVGTRPPGSQSLRLRDPLRGLRSGEIHLLPLALGFAFQALILAGPAFAFAAASVLFRDVSQLIGPLLTVVFYLTPILYPESLVPPGLAWALDANPVRDVAGFFRAGLIGTEAPPAGRTLAWASVFAVLAFLGHRFFERSRKVFADVL